MINDVSERDPVEMLAEEFLERRRRNETPTPEDYARDYPDLAERIRTVFPALMLLEELSPQITGTRAEEAPKQLGEFRIIRQIGRGGMGVVYEAVQQSLERRVALKVLPQESARDPVYVDRFRSEARTAARLHHTNIVAVHGAGHADGMHFLVMQLIDGVGLDVVIGQLKNAPSPITVSAKSGDTNVVGDSAEMPAASSRRGKSTPLDLVRLHDSDRPAYYRAIARLIAEAADALAHAHQLGVVHRDIKPSNLLLASDGSLYVNDFGLAKAEGGADLTRTGLVVGTPRYLAPERFNGVEGPASDVFALGATLYELLTLRPAFDAPTRERLIEQIHKAEPVQPRSIASDVPRDLETIAIAALAKEPGRRPSASVIADDLRRWLDGRPIRSRRIGPIERLAIWARRNPLVASLTVGLFLALSCGLSVALGLWRTSEGHRIEAEANAGVAGRRLGQVEKVNDILIGVFSDLDPRGEQTDEKSLRLTLGKRLDEAADQIDAAAIGDPRTVTTIQDRLGTTLSSLGQFDKAIAVLTKTAESSEKQFGPDNADTLKCRHDLASALYGAGRLPEAIAIAEDVLRRREVVLGIDDVSTLASRGNLATLYEKSGRTHEALQLHEQVLAQRLAKLGPTHRDTITSRNSLAIAQFSAGRTAQAIQMHEETLALCRSVLGPNHHNTITSRSNVAALYLRVGRAPESATILEENLAARTVALGAEHPDTLLCRSHLGDAYRACKRTADAIAMHEETLKLRTRVLGPLHVDTLRSRSNLGRAYREANRTDEAITMHEETLRMRTLALGLDHPDTLASSNDLAVSYRHAGRAGDAIKVHEETLKLRVEKLGADHQDTQRSAGNLATAYVAEHRHADAERVLRDLVASRERTLASDDPVLADTQANLGRSLLAQEKYAEAEPCYRAALSMRARLEPAGWLTADSRGRLGEALLGQKQFDEAESHLLEAHSAMVSIAETGTEAHKARVKYTARRILKLYQDWGKPEKAAQWQAK